LSRERFHAKTLAEQAIAEGAELIVAVGGDSTLSEIANGLTRSKRYGRPIPKLSLYPFLQQGDFVKSIQLRPHFSDFLKAYLNGEAIEEAIDLGEVEFTGDHGHKIKRIFINCAGFGFSAIVANKLSLNHKLKRTRFSYLKLIAQSLPLYRYPEITVELNDKPFVSQEEVLTGLLHNGKAAARGLIFSEKSDIHDGKFEFTLIRKTFTYRYLISFLNLFSKGLKTNSFTSQTQCQKVKVFPSRSDRKVRIDFDGDAWGDLPAEFRVLEKALVLVR
jgi:diacylglycerol kinase family enzyme